MCVICIKPKNEAAPSADILTEMWFANPDGAGLAYNADGKVEIVRSLMTVGGFLKVSARIAEEHPEAAIVYHCRISTHGSLNGKNTHPHRVNRKLAMAHNGVIGIHIDKDCDDSDTVTYNRQVLQQLPEGFLKEPAMRYLLDTSVGNGKLAFLDGDGNHTIIGESRGMWEDGLWYSNRSWKPSVYTGKAFAHGGGWSSGWSGYSANARQGSSRNNPDKITTVVPANLRLLDDTRSLQEEIGSACCEECGLVITQSADINGFCDMCFSDIIAGER